MALTGAGVDCGDVRAQDPMRRINANSASDHMSRGKLSPSVQMILCHDNRGLVLDAILSKEADSGPVTVP